MEKTKRSNQSKSLAIILILISVLGIVVSMLFWIIYKTKDYEYDNLKNEIAILTNATDEVSSEKKETLDKLNFLLNIDKEISNLREETFANASSLEKKIQNKEANVKIAYLTFDDGPYYNSLNFLEVLKEKDVKATFFTTSINGQYCYDNKKYDCQTNYQKYLDAGHTIANHTYSHGIFRGLYSSVDSFMSSLQKQEDLIKEKTNGYVTNIMRFPGGSSTAKSLKKSLITSVTEKGYGWVDWTAQDGDGGELSGTTEAWNIFTKSINDDIEVVLMHDYNKYTLSILPKAIDYLRENNYILLPLFYESVMVNK